MPTQNPHEVIQYLSAPCTDKFLRAGGQLHVFRSGGGLRVVRLEQAGDVLKGYGEHPHLEVALQHAEEDLAAGGRPYKKVYGPIHTHYMTGTTACQSPLDGWACNGSGIDADFNRESGKLRLRLGWMPQQTLVEAAVHARVRQTRQPEEYNYGPFRYLVTLEPKTKTRFGSDMTASECFNPEQGQDRLDYLMPKQVLIYEADDLLELWLRANQLVGALLEWGKRDAALA